MACRFLPFANTSPPISTNKFLMPFDSKRVMWQLSFPLSEKEAKNLSDLLDKIR